MAKSVVTQRFCTDVLQISAGVSPRDGGPNTGIRGLNREFREMGTDSIVLATTADGMTASLGKTTAAPVDEDGALIQYCSRSRPYRLKNSWSQATRAHRLAQSAQMIHIHGIYLANAIWAYMAARATGTPYVVQPHGTLEPYQRQFGSRQKRIYDAIIGKRILRNADAIIAASDSEAQNIKAILPKANIVVAPLGVTRASPRLNISHQMEIGNWLHSPQHNRVIFLGRLAAKKRPDLLIRAWEATSQDGHLLFVGPAQDWSEQSLKNLVARGSHASITFLPSVDSAGVAWLLEKSGIFVLPSENENFGISVAEAMLHECAIVTTQQTAAGCHVTEAGAGIVLDDPNISDLSNALEDLMDQPEKVERLGKSGREYASRKLTWRATAVVLQDAYRKICDARASRPTRS